MIEPDNVHETHCLNLDISKAIAKLEWMPKWNLELSLQSILSWHKAYLDGEDMHDVTLRQIASFSACADIYVGCFMINSKINLTFHQIQLTYF